MIPKKCFFAPLEPPAEVTLLCFPAFVSYSLSPKKCHHNMKEVIWT